MSERTSASRTPTITTTHAAWGAGHPRILVAREGERFVHQINCDVTHIGSADDSDLLLPSTDPLHARILHDTTDEYILTMIGEGKTSSGPHETLRTGAHFAAGPWQLVFVRDEFADHGRPYGGRRGGELAEQRPQPARPNYAVEHPASSLTRCAVKQPESASEIDETRALGHAVLNDARSDSSEKSAAAFRVVNDETAGIYEATIGDTRAGGVTYNVVGNDRIILLGVCQCSRSSEAGAFRPS